MPTEFRSKLNNIYLVALSYTDDAKTKETDFNNLWMPIRNDIHQLETVGITIDDNLNIKGTISFLGFDNLGANVSLGLSGGFNCVHYCRICMCKQSECQQATSEDEKKFRTKENYKEQLKVVESSTKVDYKETIGIRQYCILNDLDFFHIFENKSLDLMHDLNEGNMVLVMRNLFNYLIKNALITEQQLADRFASFDYGELNESNKPSTFNLTKLNLGQNASQSKCLFLHLPFILYDFRNNKFLKRVWICVQSLLRVSQIVFSEKISKFDIISLKKESKLYLDSYRKHFNDKLTPKQHNLTHFASVIEESGPVVFMSMMRPESKHKSLKNIMNKSNNYVNIIKSIAHKHQEILASTVNTYKNSISFGKLSSVDSDIYKSMFDLTNEDIFKTDFVIFNSFKYKKEFLILFDEFLHEITEILVFEQKIYFVIKQYDFVKLDTFCNAYIITETIPLKSQIIELENLLLKKPYEKKIFGGQIYVIADTLHLKMTPKTN